MAMATTFNYVVPHMIVDGDQEAMEQAFFPATYDGTLTGNAVYVEGDLVEFHEGKVRRSARTTPADVPTLFLAGAAWAQTFGLTRGSQTTRTLTDVPLNIIPAKNEFVFTYQHDKNDTTPHEFAAADLQAVQARQAREIAWNDEEKCYTIRNGTTNPRVVLVGLFKGVVGDSNVQVRARIITPGIIGPAGPTGPTGP
jgi:hypothetical protein